MLKRKLWSPEEDAVLQKLMLLQPLSPQWDIIAKKMAELNYFKTAKQCKDRWLNNLSPLLNKSKWTLSESQELFKQYLQHGNKWKNISRIFVGRTDNAVKNQFFSVIRKSLRTMNKYLGINCNTGMINNIRPKILAELLSPEPVNEKRNILVQKFAFTPYSVLTKEIGEHDRETVTECIKFVIEQNDAYIAKKLNKSKIKKISKSVTTSRSSQIAKTVVNVEIIPTDGMTIEENESLNVENHQISVPEIEKPKSAKIIWIEDQIKELTDLQQLVSQSSQYDQDTLKQNTIEFFAKLTDLSSKIKNLLENADDAKEALNLTEYLCSTSKFADFFKPEINNADNKPITTHNDHENSDHDILGSIHDFNRNKENDALECQRQFTFPIRDSQNTITSNNIDILQLNKRVTISTNDNHSADMDFKKTICLFDAELDKRFEVSGGYPRDRKISAELFEEMLDEFDCSDYYL